MSTSPSKSPPRREYTPKTCDICRSEDSARVRLAVARINDPSRSDEWPVNVCQNHLEAK